MIKIEDKRACSGCSACATKCPQKCIQMTVDKEGFLYPSIDEAQCINCELCAQICPVINSKPTINDPVAYAVINKNLNVRNNSSSGGVFSLIANLVLENKGVVFGAAFDETEEPGTRLMSLISGLAMLFPALNMVMNANTGAMLANSAAALFGATVQEGANATDQKRILLKGVAIGAETADGAAKGANTIATWMLKIA